MGIPAVEIFYIRCEKGWFWKRADQRLYYAKGPYRSEIEARYHACRTLGFSYHTLLRSLRRKAA